MAITQIRMSGKGITVFTLLALQHALNVLMHNKFELHRVKNKTTRSCSTVAVVSQCDRNIQYLWGGGHRPMWAPQDHMEAMCSCARHRMMWGATSVEDPVGFFVGSFLF